MEKEFTDPAPYYYSGGGQFYSPQLVRSLSEAGQTSSSGPGGGSGGGSGFGGQSAGQSAGNGSGGFSPNFSPSLQQGAEAYGVYVGANAAVQGITALVAYLTAGEVALGPPGWIAAAASGLFVLFDDLFGGGSDNPAPPRQLRHGRHPLYPVMLGVPDGLIPTMGSAGAPPICGDPHVCNKCPLQKDKNVTKDPAAIFNDCIHENLMTGEGSVPYTLCYGLTIGCVATGAAPVCLTGGVMCLYGIGVEAYCTSKALHENPPPLPPVPVPDTKGLPGFE
jgi:hypothetical protein